MSTYTSEADLLLMEESQETKTSRSALVAPPLEEAEEAGKESVQLLLRLKH